MTDKDKIRNIIELFIAWNGETEPIDVANIDSAVEFIGSSLQEEPVSKNLEEAAIVYNKKVNFVVTGKIPNEHFIAGAKWQREHFWKPITEIPTKHWANNYAISPLYLVKCGEKNRVSILGYSNYSFATKSWLDCYNATESGVYKVTEWTDIKL